MSKSLLHYIRNPRLQFSLFLLLVIAVHAIVAPAQAPPVLGASCPASGLTGITAAGISVTCTQPNGGGALVWTNLNGSTGGGTPGGSPGSVQFNVGGTSLGGFGTFTTGSPNVLALGATQISTTQIGTATPAYLMPSTGAIGQAGGQTIQFTGTDLILTTFGGNNIKMNSPVTFQSVAFASIGAVPAAGITKFCTDCTTGATCAGSGSGHLAVSNGTNWTCQ